MLAGKLMQVVVLLARQIRRGCEPRTLLHPGDRGLSSGVEFTNCWSSIDLKSRVMVGERECRRGLEVGVGAGDGAPEVV